MLWDADNNVWWGGVDCGLVGLGDSGGDVDCGVGFGNSGIKRDGDFSNSAAGADNSCEVWLQQRREKE